MKTGCVTQFFNPVSAMLPATVVLAKGFKMKCKTEQFNAWGCPWEAQCSDVRRQCKLGETCSSQRDVCVHEDHEGTSTGTLLECGPGEARAAARHSGFASHTHSISPVRAGECYFDDLM